MAEYGRCQSRNCDRPAYYRLDWGHQPGSLRACEDCAEELAVRGRDELTRLQA
jgi:hypothetical protein